MSRKIYTFAKKIAKIDKDLDSRQIGSRPFDRVDSLQILRMDNDLVSRY